MLTFGFHSTGRALFPYDPHWMTPFGIQFGQVRILFRMIFLYAVLYFLTALRIDAAPSICAAVICSS